MMKLQRMSTLLHEGMAGHCKVDVSSGNASFVGSSTRFFLSLLTLNGIIAYDIIEGSVTSNHFLLENTLLYHFDHKFTNSEILLAEMADKFSFEFQ
jgi:hypothetical protein